jgi:two-component sensor histidine kinase
MTEKEEQIRFRIEDNGIGMPENLDKQQVDSLGLDLVNDLVVHQLHGELTLQRAGGTRWTITFSK